MLLSLQEISWFKLLSTTPRRRLFLFSKPRTPIHCHRKDHNYFPLFQISNWDLRVDLGKQLKFLGLIIKQLKFLGFNIKQLKFLGLIIKQLNFLGFIIKQLKFLGLIIKQLTFLGFNIKQLKFLGLIIKQFKFLGLIIQTLLCSVVVISDSTRHVILWKLIMPDMNTWLRIIRKSLPNTRNCKNSVEDRTIETHVSQLKGWLGLLILQGLY